MPLRSLTTVPPGGWRLQQTLADGSVKSWASMGLIGELASTIADFRAGNGLPRATVHDAIEDIEAATCARLHDDPAWCVKKNPHGVRAAHTSGNLVRHAADGVKVLVDWLGSGAKPVAIEVAQARANVCRKCPENKLGHSWLRLTADVVRAIADQMRAKDTLKLRLDDEEALGTCRVCSCVLSLKCHVPLATILEHTSDETLAALPSHCWMNTERRSL